MKKLVLDLDETLVFSTLESVGPDCVLLKAGGSPFYTMLRPGTKDFLERMHQKFEITIWTTGQQAYLESVWDYIGIEGCTLWGRDFCKRIDNPSPSTPEPYEKPLRKVCEDLSQVVLVDNTPSMFAKYPVNGILTRTWRGDPNDTELTHLGYYLEWLEKQPSLQRDHHAWRIETLCLRSK